MKTSLRSLSIYSIAVTQWSTHNVLAHTNVPQWEKEKIRLEQDVPLEK